MRLPLLKQLQIEAGLLLRFRETPAHTQFNTFVTKGESVKASMFENNNARKVKRREKNISWGYSFIVSLDCVCANEESLKTERKFKKKLK